MKPSEIEQSRKFIGANDNLESPTTSWFLLDFEDHKGRSLQVGVGITKYTGGISTRQIKSIFGMLQKGPPIAKKVLAKGPPLKPKA